VNNLKPRERTPLPVEKEAVGHPEQVWLFWRREESPVSARIQTPHRPALSVVALPSTLSCLPPTSSSSTLGEIPEMKKKLVEKTKEKKPPGRPRRRRTTDGS